MPTSHFVVQLHSSELPSRGLRWEGPCSLFRLLGSGRFVKLCLETPRFGAHAICSSCWGSCFHVLLKLNNVLQPRGCPEAWKCTEGPRVMGTHAYIITRGYALDCTGVVYNSIYNIHKRNVECTRVGLPDEKHGMYFVRIPRFPRNDGMTCLNLHRNKIHAISHTYPAHT